MSFYIIDISNNRFWLKKEFIHDIHDILHDIRILCENRYDLSFIKLYITNFNEMEMQDREQIIQERINFSSKNLINYDVVSYLNEHNKFLHKCIISQSTILLSSYSENTIIIRALFQLISIIERVPLLQIVKSNQTKISLRLKSELRFINEKFSLLIQREIFLAYLQNKNANHFIPSLKITDDTVHIPTNTNIKLALPTNTNYTCFTNIHNLKIYQVFKLVLNAFFIVDIREIKNLISVNKDLYTLFNPQECMPIFRNNLKDIIVNIYKLDYDIFIELLLKLKGIISGGTVLQSIFGNHQEYNKSSDLDIFIDAHQIKTDNEKKDIENLLNFLLEKDYEIQQKTYSSLEQTHDHVNFVYLDPMLHFSFVKSYKHTESKRSIQIIYIDNPYNIPFGEWVTYKCDISFLKNYFDGHDFHIYYLDHIIKRTGIILPSILRESSYKYDGIYHIDPKELYKYFVFNTNLHIRILKYLSRGYTIDEYEEFKAKSIFY